MNWLFWDFIDSIFKSPQTLDDEAQNLAETSGLIVRKRKDHGNNVFDFFDSYHRTVKTAFTYKKAKMFAEGVKYGRENQ